MELLAMPYWSDIVPALRRWWPVAIVFVLCYFGWLLVRQVEHGRHLAALQSRSKLPVHFAFAELAALDRDVQRRFAVVPDQDFGLDRIGKQHSLYMPKTDTEKATIAALKRQRLQVTFYVMSRRSWLGQHTVYGLFRLQGPLYLTPPPSDFEGRVSSADGIWNRDNHFEPFTEPQFITSDGIPIPPPPAPDDLPSRKEMYRLGAQVFDKEKRAENSPMVPVGQSRTLGSGRWQVLAVPIRANDEACVNCHNNSRLQSENIVLNDVIGMAMYAYRPARPLPQLERQLRHYGDAVQFLAPTRAMKGK